VAGPRGEFTEDEKKLIVAYFGEGKTDAEVSNVLKILSNVLADRFKYNLLIATIGRAKKNPNKKVDLSIDNGLNLAGSLA
jgi:hypothetical protein